MLKRAITEIGRRMVQCSETCAGVVHDAAAGILPRGLILERAECDGRGCLVAGNNPCRSNPQERAYYRESGPSYKAVNTYWHENVERIPYFKSLRRFLNLLDLKGPIIWSGLAKCENSPDVKGLIPLQTLRICAGRFLQEELEKLPADWPVFGLGKEAYKALAYLGFTRTVIGIPHPIGSPGQFRELFANGRLINGRLRQHVAATIAAASADGTPVAVWVS